MKIFTPHEYFKPFFRSFPFCFPLFTVSSFFFQNYPRLSVSCPQNIYIFFGGWGGGGVFAIHFIFLGSTPNNSRTRSKMQNRPERRLGFLLCCRVCLWFRLGKYVMIKFLSNAWLIHKKIGFIALPLTKLQLHMGRRTHNLPSFATDRNLPSLAKSAWPCYLSWRAWTRYQS